MPTTDTSTTAPPQASANWPTDARDMLATLENQFPPLYERRKIARHRYHTTATFTTESLGGQAVSSGKPVATVYVRDVNQWAIGYISSARLSSHAKGKFKVEGPDGHMLELPCLVRRTREFAPGWFQGVLEFDMPQKAFTEDSLKATQTKAA